MGLRICKIHEGSYSYVISFHESESKNLSDDHVEEKEIIQAIKRCKLFEVLRLRERREYNR